MMELNTTSLRAAPNFVHQQHYSARQVPNKVSKNEWAKERKDNCKLIMAIGKSSHRLEKADYTTINDNWCVGFSLNGSHTKAAYHTDIYKNYEEVPDRKRTHNLSPQFTIFDSKEGLTARVKGDTIASGARNSMWRKPHHKCGYNYARLLAGVPVIQHPQGEYRGLSTSGSSSRLLAVLEAVREVFINAHVEAFMTVFKLTPALTLARKLGYIEPENIYLNIYSYQVELEAFGPLCIDSKGEEIYLNPDQTEFMSDVAPVKGGDVMPIWEMANG